MITLKEAFKLCGVDDREVIHFADSLDSANLWSWPLTGQEVRQKYDMKNTLVTAIRPHFCCGEFEGVTFIIQKSKQEVN